MHYELKERSFFGTIGQGFNLYFNNFIFLFFTSLFITIPLTYMDYFHIGDNEYSSLVINLLDLIIGILLSGLFVNVISKKYLEQSLHLSDFTTNIAKLFFPLFALSIIEGLGIGFGMILLLIPGLMLTVGWAIATQVLVVEKTSITESLSRSWELTHGYKWNIFGLLVIVGLIQIIVYYCIIYLFTEFSLETSLIANHILTALIQPIEACVLIVLFFNLKIKKEGYSIEHLIKQFGTIKEEKNSE